MPGSADIQANLRAEFRKDGSHADRTKSVALLLRPARAFARRRLARACQFRPHRASFPGSDLGMDQPRSAADHGARLQREDEGADRGGQAARSAAGGLRFQTKVFEIARRTLAAAESADQIRSKLRAYTASPSAFDDVIKLMQALRARDALAKFDDALPERIAKFDDAAGQENDGAARRFPPKNALTRFRSR